MKELNHQQVIPESGRNLFFKVELHGGSAKLYNLLSDGTPEAVYNFDGTEEPLKRRFKNEILEGDTWYFELTGGAKAFYR